MVSKDTERGAGKPSRFVRRMRSLLPALAIAGVIQVTGVPGLSQLEVGGIESAEARREKPKTRRSQTVGESVGKALIKAQESVGAGNYAEALSILTEVQRKDDLKPYEQVVVIRMIGYVHVADDDFKKAILAFEQAHGLRALNEQDQADLLFYLGQLYLAEDRVDKAIRTLEPWLSQAGDSAEPQAYFVLAQAYAIMEDYKRALDLAEHGLYKARVAEKLRESWFRFTAAMYYKNQLIKNMQDLLHEMVALYPGEEKYRNQLAATYALLESDNGLPRSEVNVEVDSNGVLLSISDIQPIVRVAPRYPLRAAENGTEGWILLEFTVNATGAVENPVVLESDPPNTFNEAATRAVLRWKYKPIVVDGKPVAWKTQVVLTFELEKD